MNTTHHTPHKAFLRLLRGNALLVALSALLFTDLPVQAQVQAGSAQRVSLRVPSFQCNGAKNDYAMSGKAIPCWGTGTRQPLYAFDFKGPHGGGGGGGGGQNAFKLTPATVSFVVSQSGQKTLRPGIKIPDGAKITITSGGAPISSFSAPLKASVSMSASPDPADPNPVSSQVVTVDYTAPGSLDAQKTLQSKPLVLEIRADGDTQNQVSKISITLTGSPTAPSTGPTPSPTPGGIK